MEVKEIEVFNMAGAIRGMRNPLNSWDRSDSYWDIKNTDSIRYIVGPNDLALMQRLIIAGTEHRKFLRQIFISMDITAPEYWWKQFATYQIGTVSNSTSTMHKLTSKPVELNDFEISNFSGDLNLIDDINLYCRVDEILDTLEQLRQKYLQTKDKKYWNELIRWLPMSYKYLRTVTMNYEVARNIISQRKNHKIKDWDELIEVFRALPYAEELLFFDKN